ncbi:glycosyltransferase family 2 protein [Peribacillus frigoritolerans]
MKDVGMVMPVYNQDSNYLILSLNSILQQTYKNFHLIIVIDGANDETKGIVYRYKNDSRITIIEKDTNEGISKALNTGFDYLNKIDEVQFLTWVSSDNILYPDFIKKLYDKIKYAPPEVGLVYSGFHEIDENGNRLHNKLQQEYFLNWQQNKTKNDILDICFIGASFMYKKRYAVQIEGYYFEPVEDYEYWLRLTEICDVEFVPEELMGYRFHSPLSLSKDIHTDKKKHRWWRDQFNLARHKARLRRKIPYETTILFPVFTIDHKTLEGIESLLEQLYHNYWLIIIDNTHEMKNTLKHLGINDHRITVIENSISDCNLLKHIATPETPCKLVYSKGFDFSDISNLSHLIQTIKNNKSLGYWRD